MDCSEVSASVREAFRKLLRIRKEAFVHPNEALLYFVGIYANLYPYPIGVADLVKDPRYSKKRHNSKIGILLQQPPYE